MPVEKLLSAKATGSWRLGWASTQLARERAAVLIVTMQPARACGGVACADDGATLVGHPVTLDVFPAAEPLVRGRNPFAQFQA